MRRSRPLLVVLLVLSWGMMTSLNPPVAASSSPTLIEADTYTLPGTGYCVSFSPDGDYIAVGHLESPYFTLLDHTTTGQVTLADTYTLPESGHAVSFSPDGDYIAVAHFGAPYFTLLDHTIPGQVNLADTYTLPSTGWGVSFSPDGDYIAVGHSTSPYFTLLDHTTPGQVTLADTYMLPGVGYSVPFSPDGNYIAVANFGAPHFTLLDHTTPGQVTLADTYTLPATGRGVSFSPEGSYIAVAHHWSPYFTLLTFAVEPNVTTKPATDVTSDTVTLNMEFTVGDHGPVEVRFNWRESGTDPWVETTWTSKAADGTHAATLTGLDSDTTYDFKAQLEYNSTVIDGSTLQFTTGKVIPTITTGAASAVTTDSATLNMSYTPGDYIPDVRFAYKRAADLAWTHSPWVTHPGSPYALLVSGLDSDTTYEFKAQLEYNSNMIEGSTLQFATGSATACVQTEPGTGMACFTTGHGAIEDLEALPAIPPGAPAGIMFPHGMFSFKVTGLALGQTVTITVELPEPVPTGTRWWKEHMGAWYSVPVQIVGPNTITITLTDGSFPGDTDGVADGTITDPGGPGNPSPAVGWETQPVNKLAVLAPWTALLAVIGASLLMLRRRRAQI